MQKTVIGSLQYSPDEFAIVAMLSDQTLRQIAAIQVRLKQVLGDAIWLTPARTMHSTLLEIICNTQYKGATRKEYFEQWHEHYNQKTADIIASHRPFTVRFTELYMSPGAIILKGENTEQYNAIRHQITTQTTIPQDTKKPPTIVHISIARYNQSIDLDRARQLVGPIEVAIDEPITSFKLMNDLSPPDFVPRCVETYRLRG